METAMNRHLFMLDVTVKDRERAFLTKNGRFERVLEPGRHTLFDFGRALAVEVFDVVGTEFPADRFDTLKATHPDVADRLFARIENGATEVSIVLFNGRPVHILQPWAKRVFWKVVNTVTVERIDVAENLRVADRHRVMMNITNATTAAEQVIAQHEEGLLFVDGAFVEVLKPGRHTFWTTGRRVEVKRFDMRPTAVEIAAQEILTKDRIALRITLTAFRRIVDPVTVAQTVPDLDAWLYRLVQFAIREAVAGRTLDEILAARSRVDEEVRAFVAERVTGSGVEVADLGVKDVIMPGEVRDLVNEVVKAERLARANLIRRQEETAATRSLLNTAKLMEDNPLVLRLKELESLERVVEKVGRIDVSTGASGLDALTSQLVRLGKPAA
jgi:regulator of protease activity HflC (stomatin/prohibitin superfamily)